MIEDATKKQFEMVIVWKLDRFARNRYDNVAKAVVAEYQKEFSDSRISDLEKAMDQINRELDKLVDALIDAPKFAHQKIYSRMEVLEAQKADIDLDLSRLRIAQTVQLTESDVRA